MKIDVNNTRLNTWDTGGGCDDRPTLVFLHYFDGSGKTWTEVIAALSSEYRCIAPDLCGFGDSTAPTSVLRVDNNAADVCALVKALGLTRFVLVGHSMGGKITQATAARLQSEPNAGGLQSLFLVAPSPPVPEPMSSDERERLRQAWGNYEMAVETAHKISRLPLSPALVERTARDMLRASRTAHDAWLDFGSQENITAQASTITVPVTVIAGEHDPVFSAGLLSDEIGAVMPQSRLIIVPGCGHLLPLEATGEVVRLLRDAI